MSYINVEQLIDIITECKDEPFKKSSVYAILVLMPSADVRENIHGEWVVNSSATNLFDFYCSNCNRFHAVRSNFCPHCGADMRERKETE